MSAQSAEHEESRPLSLELRIDAARRSFEAAWEAAREGGARPRIEEYLAAAKEAGGWPLLQALLKLEDSPRRLLATPPGCLARPGPAVPRGAVWLFALQSNGAPELSTGPCSAPAASTPPTPTGSCAWATARRHPAYLRLRPRTWRSRLRLGPWRLAGRSRSGHGPGGQRDNDRGGLPAFYASCPAGQSRGLRAVRAGGARRIERSCLGHARYPSPRCAGTTCWGWGYSPCKKRRVVSRSDSGA
jgi:hypothetical protein